MSKTHKLINAAVNLHTAVIAAVHIPSVFICAATTVIWFATAPFVPDQLEQKIQQPIIPAAIGIGASLGWLMLSTAAIELCQNHPNRNQQRSPQANLSCQHELPPLPSFNSGLQPEQTALRPMVEDRALPIACQGCQNYHGQFYGGQKLTCAFHPFGWDSDKCPDW